MREHYFDRVKMNDPALIYSPVYTQKTLTFLSFFREPAASRSKQEDLFTRAVDRLMTEAGADPEVSGFILNFLIDGFEKSGLDNVLLYIADNYLEENCETDNSRVMKDRLEAYKRMKTGERVDDIVLPGLDGKPHRLSDVDRNYVLLVFWASWCPHCRDLMPRLREWYERNADDSGVSIYAVAIDSSLAGLEEYMMEHELPWVNVYESDGWDGRVVRRFNIYATPSMFLLDRNRKILAKPVTFKDFKKEVEKKLP